MKRQRRHGKRSSAWIRPEKRYAIYVRDGFACVWCGEFVEEPTLDHLFPRRHRLHDNDPRYLVTSCRRHNTSRKAAGVAAFLRALREDGIDIALVVWRLQRARYVPLNRKAGQRALAAARAASVSQAPLPADFVFQAGGVPV